VCLERPGWFLALLKAEALSAVKRGDDENDPALETVPSARIGKHRGAIIHRMATM
jgi:hypothetical protein